jgi:multiple sugar transport system permease protein
LNKNKLKTVAIAYSFLAPGLIGLLLFTLFPVMLSLFVSFSEWNFATGLSGIKFAGLSNFINLFKDKWFLTSLKNNFIFSFSTVPLTMAIALVMAVIVERYVSGKTIVRLLIYIPNILGSVVVANIWRVLLSKRGAINILLSKIFGPDLPSWLGDPTWAFPAIILMSIWGGVGYVFILYMSGLQNIPETLYEAAELDGAGGVQAFIHITIPMLSPITFFILITQIIFSFRVFAQIQILTQGGPGMATTVTAYYIYVTAFQYYKMGYASAMTWILFIIIFGFTLFQWNMQKRREYT